jgi:magnesium transporter
MNINNDSQELSPQVASDLVYSEQQPKICVIRYNANFFETFDISQTEPLPEAQDHSVTWLQIPTNASAAQLRDISNFYGLHDLAMEDISNPQQRPKCERFGEYMLIIAKHNALSENEVISSNYSIVLGQDIALSFGDTVGDFHEQIVRRLRDGHSRIRKRKADYLAYFLLDAIVDHDLLLTEQLEEETEQLEQDLLAAKHAVNVRQAGLLYKLYHLRTKVMSLRKHTRPMREVLRELSQDEGLLFDPQNHSYLRDVYDHTHWIADNIEQLREMLTGMMDFHLSRANNRMSEVMKVLAMISAIFVPLNLIAGIYGMNFKFMPELEMRGAYFVVLGLMLLLATIMMIVFKNKRWY